ncbi:hypothetical protein [Pedobacter xixiisoli]|uniref:hypothetical protein n=1 Tax=Pedobacter xixiisoli TaxID=1476464 RepID=UPI001F0FAA24|nr:hypothetical protein [Pedobacter xixiisoli]
MAPWFTGAIRYLTRKDAFGRTKMDGIKDKAPEWIEKAKTIVPDLKAGHMPKV